MRKTFTLAQSIAETERTDPVVRAAAEKYEAAVKKILAKPKHACASCGKKIEKNNRSPGADSVTRAFCASHCRACSYPMLMLAHAARNICNVVFWITTYGTFDRHVQESARSAEWGFFTALGSMK